MKTIERDIVGAFILSSDGYLLLGKSLPGGAYDHLWVIPGGGIEPGETALDAMKREVLEEVGVDVSGAHIEQLNMHETGESKKIDRVTGEQLFVRMKFIDFKVELSQPAAEVTVKSGDDFREAKWFNRDELSTLPITPAMQATLRYLRFI